MNGRAQLSDAAAGVLHEVRRVLKEGVGAATLPEDDRAPLVLYGAGRLGSRTLAGARAEGRTVLAFTDAAPHLWGTSHEGVPVLSPQDAVARFGQTALFVVAVWRTEGGHTFGETRALLSRLGCSSVVSFVPLYWRYAERFLPYLTIDRPDKVVAARDDVERAAALWADEASRCQYVAQLRWRLQADFDAVTEACAGEQYFPPDLVRLRPGEVFVDCGAYDGDTLRSLLSLCPDFAAAHSFEPDPASFAALATYRAGLPSEVAARVALHAVATSDSARVAKFAGQGSLSSGLHAAGSHTVTCATLDGVLAGVTPTFLKLDVEGAEAATLRGAERIIRRHRPVIAAAAYHCQSDLWDLPLQLAALCVGYRFYLRAHQAEGFELVCYAVPEERVVAGAQCP